MQKVLLADQPTKTFVGVDEVRVLLPRLLQSALSGSFRCGVHCWPNVKPCSAVGNSGLQGSRGSCCAGGRACEAPVRR